MDLLCHPTTRDCSAIVVAEAGVAGVPSITTNVGGIPELIEHGRTGYIFDSGDDASFIETIVALARSPELLGEMKARVRQKAQTEFTAQAVFASIVRQVHQALTDSAEVPRIDGVDLGS
jgi:glycosyltransferase involved in cell wall biosynthesis